MLNRKYYKRRGFISASDTIQPPSTQENLPLWTYCLSLYRHRNAATTSATTLDLFKSFATELFHKDKQASLLPVSARHTKFSSITSVKEIPKIDIGRMRLYFSPWSRNQQYSLSGEFHLQTVIHPYFLKETISTLSLARWLVPLIELRRIIIEKSSIVVRVALLLL